ncbi:hypothetical protein B0J11DRAFT_250335 [Dendryphion nanum]|uniref:F-box domain-containing protein n=1 Tax=Dendryphion nanum TaxID=256645 RepID=A0A9P9E1P1_9PLEO|nr:hypothetical protein B0J11DRAFT_250335 [Dendryphion nanum]
MSIRKDIEMMSGCVTPSTLHDDSAPFRFFSLPPELRNQIYRCMIELHPVLNIRYQGESGKESTENVPLPLHALCTSSEQLRAEFYPIWLNDIHHVVPLKNVEKYLATFEQQNTYCFTDGILSPHASATSAPHRNLTITLSTDGIYTTSIGVYINILPIIKLKIATPSFDIKFTVGLRPIKVSTDKSLDTPSGPRAGAEATRLSTILGNRNKLWLQLIENGIDKVEIDSWGMVVRVYLKKNAVGELMGRDWVMELAENRRNFEAKLGLENLRCAMLVTKD